MTRDDAVRAAAEATDSRARTYGLNATEHESFVEAAVDAAEPHLTADLERERNEAQMERADALAEVERARREADYEAGGWDAHDKVLARAEKAEAERDEALAEVERLREGMRLHGHAEGMPCHHLYSRCFPTDESLREYRVRQREHGAREAIARAASTAHLTPGDNPTTEDRPMTDYTDARAVYFAADDDGNPDSWQVQAGEYADEPDLVIVILDAMDPEGRDVRESVAREVAALLNRADR